MRLPVGGGGALLVTAHPDDETMFFTPAVRALMRKGTQLHVPVCRAATTKALKRAQWSSHARCHPSRASHSCG